LSRRLSHASFPPPAHRRARAQRHRAPHRRLQLELQRRQQHHHAVSDRHLERHGLGERAHGDGLHHLRRPGDLHQERRHPVHRCGAGLQQHPRRECRWTYGIGTLSGTVTTGGTLTATLAFTTNGNTSITGNWSLTYESLSDTTSSPSAFAGTYTDSASGATFTITTGGAINITNSPNGCSLTGKVTTSDTTHNIYQVSYSYTGCTGTYQPLNGVQFTGLGTINSTLSPAQAVIAATGTLNGDYFGIITTLTSTS
jgi:hypothetical protein